MPNQYLIKSGDTLGNIAAVNKTDIATLQKLNPQITNPNLIYAGQNLNLPQINQSTPTKPVSGLMSPVIASSDLARNKYNENVNVNLPKAESQFITAPPTPTKAGETPIVQPATPLSYKSDNLAFQNIIDQANKLVADAQASGVPLSPEIQQRVNDINNLQFQKTGAIADARIAADNKDAAKIDESLTAAKTADTSAQDNLNALIAELRTGRTDYIASLAPGEKEIQLKTDLQKLRTDRQLLPLELRLEGISAQGIAGRQIDDERVRAIQESNLLFEIGLEQDARQYKSAAIEKQMSWITDDINLQMKIQDKLDAKEQKVADDARQLQKDSLTALSTLVSTFEGLAWTDMDSQTQADLIEKAKQFNIPITLLESALDVAKQQKVFDNAIKSKANEPNKPTDKETLQADTANMSQNLASRTGTDGFVSPQDYLTAKKAWVAAGYASKDFDTTFSVYRNPNDTYQVD